MYFRITKIAASERSCVFWDFSTQSWSTKGCEVSPNDSQDDLTVCHCEHLTNFAVIFDFTGDAIVDYFWLNIATYIVLSISIILLVVTQIVAHNYQRLVSSSIYINIYISSIIYMINWSFWLSDFFLNTEPKVTYLKKGWWPTTIVIGA